MHTFFSKAIVLLIFFCCVLLKSNAQTTELKNDELLAFNFKTANASVSQKNMLYGNNIVATEAAGVTKKSPKTSREKKFKIAGAVLVTLGACALAGTAAGGAIYGKQLFGRNGSGNSDIKSLLRFYGILGGGIIVSNTMMGVGGWMIADGGN